VIEEGAWWVLAARDVGGAEEWGGDAVIEGPFSVGFEWFFS